MQVVVLTVDQRSSRSTTDLVPEILTRLNTGAVSPAPSGPSEASGGSVLLPFERTAGDEIQGLLVRPEAVMSRLETLLRTGSWNIGLGVGAIETPLPETTRAARGTAYLHAREAVTRAKQNAWHLSVVGTDAYRADQIETVLWLWAGVLGRRSQRGWEVADLLTEGLSHEEAGRRLGITQSAVTQRAQAAGLVDARRAFGLGTQLLAQILAGGDGTGGNVSERNVKGDR